MGRKKLEIKTQETQYERIITYNRRKHGILKKAKELSIKCDVPLALLFFSPSDKKSYEIFVGENCKFGELLQRYAAVPQEVRSKSKLEALELIKKPFAKQGTIIHPNSEVTSCHSGQTELRDMQNYLSAVQAEIKEIQRNLGPLSYLDDINSINDIKLLDEMENTILSALSHNSTLKETYPRDFQALPPLMNNCPEHAQINEDPYALQVPNNWSGQAEVITEEVLPCYASLANSSGDQIERNMDGKVFMQDVKITNEFVEGEDFYAFAERSLKLPISIQEGKKVKGKAAFETSN